MKHLIKTMAFTLLGLVLSMNLMAAESSFTIKFKDNGTDATTALTTSNFSGQIESGTDYVSAVASTANCFAGDGGLKISSNNNNGDFTLTLDQEYSITKVVLSVQNKNATTKSVKVGNTDFTTSDSWNTSSFSNLTFTGTETKSNSLYVAIGGTANKKRVGYLASITVTYKTGTTPTEPVAPSITTQPVGASYDQYATATALSIVATGDPTPTYQWYSNSTNSTSGASAIANATNASYTPSTATAGTTYYYCVATNTKGSETSNIVAVTVTAFTPTAGDYDIALNNATYGISTGANADEQSVVKQGITVVSGCKSNASNKTYYDAGHIRYYTDSYLKLTAPTGFEITKVIFHQPSSDKKWGDPKVNGETYTFTTENETDKVWNGGEEELHFAFTAQCRTTGITVTLAAASSLELIAIDVTGTPEEFWLGDDFNHNGITVTALWDDESETDVTDKAEYSGYDMSNAGKQTVTVTYKGEADTYEIEVKTIANTKETAYTPAKAIELIEAGKDLSTRVYVKGTVSKIVYPYSEDYGNITFDVSADGTTDGEQFQFYQTFKGETVDELIVWESEADAPHVGDDVIGYGKLTKYSSTYEFATKKSSNLYVDYNYVVSLTRKATLSIADITVPQGEDITPEITTNIQGDYLIEYTSSDEDVVIVVDDKLTTGTELGTATITAYVVADGYKDVSTTFDVTVVSNATLSSVTISGTPKLEYTYGDEFDKTNLTATATYSDATTADVTTTAEWTITPETLTTAGGVQVTVKATFEGKYDEKQYDVTVNKKTPEINIDDISVEVTRSTTISATTIPADAELSYTITSGDANITLVEGVITGVAEGTATIKASYAGTDEYAAAEKTFTVNVIPFVPVATWVAAEWATANNISSNTDFKGDYETLNVGDAATLKWGKGTNTSSVPQYNKNDKDARLYRYNTLTITGTGANFISGIDFNFMDNLMGSDMATDCGEYVEDATNKKSTWTGFAQQVVLTNTGTTENIQAHIASITIHYTEGTLTTLTIDDINLKLTDDPKTIVYNTNKPNPVIVYSGYDESVITIANGVVTPVGTGTTTVTATIAQDGTYSAAETTFTVKVTNKTLPTLSFAEESYTAKIGEAFTAPTLNNPQGLTITYSTTEASIADVDAATGAITHKKEGSVTITATSEETDLYEPNTASYTLNVINPNVDVLTAELIGTTSYTDWSDKQDKSGTLYAGNSTKNSDGAIQIRTSGNNSGIVSTKTVGYLRGVNVQFHKNPSGGEKVFQIYGSHSAYTSAADLYNDGTKGTLIASITTSGKVEYAYTDNNFEFVGVRSGDGAMYINSITLTWEKAALYSVTKIANKGSFKLSKSTGKVGDEITITNITPDFNYELESIKAYKDGDESTVVTLTEITDGYTFNLPEYDVVVKASFKSKGTPEGDQIALVAQSGDNYYAISTNASGNYMAAVQVTIEDDKVIVADADAKSEILWVKCAVQGKENTYVFLTEGLQYLAGQTGETNLKLQESSFEWTWNGTFYTAAGGRSPKYNGSTDFRNYSVGDEWETAMVKEMPIEIVEPGPDFILPNKAAGAYATICLPKKIAKVENATLYNVNYGDKTAIEFIEAEFENDEAGTPYLIQVENAGDVNFFYGDGETATEGLTHRALVGSLSETDQPIPSDGTAILISGGQLHIAGDWCVLTKNHAYINVTELEALTPLAPIAGAPRRTVRLYNPDAQAPTNLNGLNDNVKAAKVLRDGQLYIIRDAKTYNAQGIEVQ